VTAEKRFVPWVCLVLLVANIGVFALEIAKGGDVMNGPSPAQMIELGGNLGALTLDGEPWRLLTSMFLHYGLIHLAMNMLLGLYQIGQITERLYGHAGFAAAYLVAGLGGSLASAIRGQAVSAGASGAVFGIVGAFLAYLILHRHRFEKKVLHAQLGNLALMIGIQIWLGFKVAGIDQAAHIGGLVTGFVVGLALELGHRDGANRLARAALVGVLGTGAIIGASFAAAPASRPVAFEPGVEAIDRVMAQWRAVVESKPDDLEMARKIENEILPAWESAQVAYIHGGGKNQVLLDYINLWRDGWKLIVEGLRGRDGTKVEAGLAKHKEASRLIP
jgi:rhomboid protease GluP